MHIRFSQAYFLLSVVLSKKISAVGLHFNAFSRPIGESLQFFLLIGEIFSFCFLWEKFSDFDLLEKFANFRLSLGQFTVFFNRPTFDVFFFAFSIPIKELFYFLSSNRSAFYLTIAKLPNFPMEIFSHFFVFLLHCILYWRNFSSYWRMFQFSVRMLRNLRRFVLPKEKFTPIDFHFD